jgi:hypothetical protein
MDSIYRSSKPRGRSIDYANYYANYYAKASDLR